LPENLGEAYMINKFRPTLAWTVFGIGFLLIGISPGSFCQPGQQGIRTERNQLPNGKNGTGHCTAGKN
jgi:hypothetical protein